MSLMGAMLFVAGLAGLIVGAELMVRGASRLASRLGIPPLVVGLTVVAYGTGAPELTVSLMALSEGQADLSVGNVVGSNIANVLLILGASALLTPLVVSRRLIRIDAPIMVGAALLAYAFSADGHIARWEGALLFLGALAYTAFLVRSSRSQSKLSDDGEDYAAALERKRGRGGLALYAGLVLTGHDVRPRA